MHVNLEVGIVRVRLKNEYTLVNIIFTEALEVCHSFMAQKLHV